MVEQEVVMVVMEHKEQEGEVVVVDLHQMEEEIIQEVPVVQALLLLSSSL